MSNLDNFTNSGQAANPAMNTTGAGMSNTRETLTGNIPGRAAPGSAGLTSSADTSLAQGTAGSATHAHHHPAGTHGTHAGGAHPLGANTLGSNQHSTTATGGMGIGAAQGAGGVGGVGAGAHTAGYSSGPALTTAGPHSTDMMNKADPRIDSDRDGRGLGHGTSGLTGTHGVNTIAGPHSSNIANKADPRVDSDLDGRGGVGNTHGTATSHAHQHGTHQTATGASSMLDTDPTSTRKGSTGTHGPGFNASSAMNPPVLPSASTSGTGSSTRFSESTAAKTQGLFGGPSSEGHGGLVGGRSGMDSIAPTSRHDGLAGRHGSAAGVAGGLAAGGVAHAAAKEAERHHQLDKEEIHGVGSTGGVSAGREAGVATRDAAPGAGQTGGLGQGASTGRAAGQGGIVGGNTAGAQGTGATGQQYSSLLEGEGRDSTMSPPKTRSGAAYSTQPGAL